MEIGEGWQAHMMLVKQNCNETWIFFFWGGGGVMFFTDRTIILDYQTTI